MPKRSRSCRAAFTLIEVLVVVGVIALLVAILLPSLARSRENARAVLCRQHLKEWSRLLIMYTNQYDDTLPFEERPSPYPDANGFVEDANGDKVWDNVTDPLGVVTEERGWICWYDAVDAYIGGGKTVEGMKVCPTVRRFEPTYEESYRMNSKLADSSRLKSDGTPNRYFMPYRRLNTLVRPAFTMLLFDGDVGVGAGVNPAQAVPSFKGRWRVTKSDVDYRHNRACNALFADWHIESIKKKTMDQKSLYNDGILWQPPDMGTWNPDPEGE